MSRPLRRRYLFQMQSVHAPLHKSPLSMYFTPSKVSRLNMVNTLIIVTPAAFLALPGTVRSAFPRAGETSRNPVTSRTRKLRGKDGSLVDEDKFRPTDERRTVEPRELNATAARRQYHWDTRWPILSITPVRESEVRAYISGQHLHLFDFRVL